MTTQILDALSRLAARRFGSFADAATSVAVRDATDPNKYRWDIILLG